MNVYDAAKILSVSGEVTPQQVKAAYVAACKKYHPDINPAGEEMMKVINAAYEVLREYSGTLKAEQPDYGSLFNDALNAVLPLPGMTIEICGVWLWVTGETRQYKDVLKGAGFKWARKKTAWYFRPEQYRSFSRGAATLEEIREKYGSKRPQGLGYDRLGGAS
ncbi:MAG: J domain-containing protein [Hyphomicrobiales bacterium]